MGREPPSGGAARKGSYLWFAARSLTVGRGLNPDDRLSSVLSRIILFVWNADRCAGDAVRHRSQKDI